MKRIVALMATMIMLFSACGKKTEKVLIDETAAPAAAEISMDDAESSMRLMGFVVDDDGSMGAYTWAHI